FRNYFRVVVARDDLGATTQIRIQQFCQATPVIAMAFTEQAKASARRFYRGAEDRQAGRVRTALRHTVEHRHDQLAERLAQLFLFSHQSYYSAHGIDTSADLSRTRDTSSLPSPIHADGNPPIPYALA